MKIGISIGINTGGVTTAMLLVQSFVTAAIYDGYTVENVPCATRSIQSLDV